MATVITSIGSKSAPDDPVDGPLTMGSASGSGTPWTGTVTFGSAPTANIGDKLYFEDVYYPGSFGGCDGGGTADVIYLITGISGDGLTLTVKYISGALSTTNPYTISSNSVCSVIAQPYIVRFYSTMETWETGLDDDDLYVDGDIGKGECYADTTFGSTWGLTINSGNGLSSGHLDATYLVAAESQRHDGIANTGVRILAASGLTSVTIVLHHAIPAVPIHRSFEWIEIDMNADNNCDTGQEVIRHYGGGDWEYSSVASHCIIHNKVGSRTKDASSAFTMSSNYSCAHNNIIYNLTADACGWGASENTNIWALYQVGNGGQFYNNTVYRLYITTGTGEAIGIADTTTTAHFYNNLIVDCEDGDFGTMGGSVVLSNNLSSDSTATGTDAITGKSAASLFVSTTPGSEDLGLKSGAAALRAGKDLGTGVTIDGDVFASSTTCSSPINFDIDNRDRDAEGDDWDIGADQCDTCYAYNFAPAFLLFLDS